MNATEVPVLDPRNFVVSGYLGGRFNIISDPVARLQLFFGRTWQQDFSYGIAEVQLRYAPDLDPNIFRGQLSEGDWKQIDEMRWIEVASQSVGKHLSGKRMLNIVKLKNFFGIGIENVDFYQTPKSSNRFLKLHEDPQFQFWPDGFDTMKKKMASYFLRMIYARMSANAPANYSNGIKEGWITGFGVAVDRPLADYMGLAEFPDAQQIDDELILLLKGDLTNAG